ncbi:MAG TPA: integrase [Gammaproteobacteria bacterium]|nr:integrase [Gammaproteobacteria bacterium]
MTPLREKMIDAMRLRGFSQRTHESYLYAVNRLANHYHQPPDRLTPDQLQAFFLYLVKQRKLSAATCRLYLNGIRFFYLQVLQWPSLTVTLTVPKRPQRIPELLTREEVGRIINACENPKHRMMLITCYGCGLRVSELVSIKVTHIDGERKLLRVEQGKGGKDRLVTLSDGLLQQLRGYWRASHPTVYLFPRYRPDRALSVTTAQKAFTQSKRQAGIEKVGGIHALRHAYATHLLAGGLPVQQLQQQLGHRDIHSTLRYVHWIPDYRQAQGPRDLVAQLGLPS